MVESVRTVRTLMDRPIKTIYRLDWRGGVFVNNINFIMRTRLTKGKKVFTLLYQNAILMNKMPLRTRTHPYINKNIPDIKTHPQNLKRHIFYYIPFILQNPKSPKHQTQLLKKRHIFYYIPFILENAKTLKHQKIPKNRRFFQIHYFLSKTPKMANIVSCIFRYCSTPKFRIMHSSLRCCDSNNILLHEIEKS
ncbi:hypothetical protein HanRHA438_Chr10g0436431 [Helianthus annuus]|nr:hypothetical protein HanRHA438_Chr10g0436431 [Helianthus annuus]